MVSWDQIKNKDFWNEAPYRTNGDVIEKIKDPLKYFIETRQQYFTEKHVTTSRLETFGKKNK